MRLFFLSLLCILPQCIEPHSSEPQNGDPRYMEYIVEQLEVSLEADRAITHIRSIEGGRIYRVNAYIAPTGTTVRCDQRRIHLGRYRPRDAEYFVSTCRIIEPQ